MTTNNDAHIDRLRDMRDWSAKDDDKPALDAAIRALSADRGEADYSVVPPELHGGDETGQAAETTDAAWANGWNACRSDVMRRVSGVYAATPPSPAESAEGELPARDPAKSNTEQGLYRKFDVRRTDGSDAAEPRVFRDIRYWSEHCVAAADEGEDYAVPRDILAALTALGLMEKCGRGKWRPTDEAKQLASQPQTVVLREQEGLMHPATQVFFRAGLLACREYMARFVSAESPSIAASIRANWWPDLGQDFGPPRKIEWGELTEGEYGESSFRVKAKEEVSPTLEALPIALQFLERNPAALVIAQPQPGRVEWMDFAAHLQRQREWSERTFGPGARTAGVTDHIRKELAEIEADPADAAEWIDVVILALDGAWRAGLSPQGIIDGITSKQAKNERRTWPDWRTADPNKAIEHDRTGETAGATP